jgi:hypothetical protein
MIVWGGFGAGGIVNTGGRYDPISDDWINTGNSNAPSSRSDHTAVWTGSEMHQRRYRQHRREVLRATWTDTNTNTFNYTYSKPHNDSYAYTYSISYSYSKGNSQASPHPTSSPNPAVRTKHIRFAFALHAATPS